MPLGNPQAYLQLQPSPARSLLTQLLLAGPTAQGSRSLAESANIAAKPIIGALLARREQKAQAQRTAENQRLVEQLLGVPQPAQTGLADPRTGQISPQQTPRLLTEGDQRNQALASILSQNPQAMQQFAMAQAAPSKQEARMIPLTAAEKSALGIPADSFAQRNSITQEIKIDDPPSNLVDVTVEGDETKPPSGYYWIDPEDPSKGVKPIPGGPAATETPEQAGKKALLQGGQEAIDAAFEIIAPEGKVNRTAVAAMQANVPGTEGRQARLYMEEAMAARLRSETGAQMNEEEVTLMRKRVMPSVLDNDATIEAKRVVMKRFFTRAEGAMAGKSTEQIIKELATEVEQESARIFEEDVQYTMQQHGLTREEVLERINAAP